MSDRSESDGLVTHVCVIEIPYKMQLKNVPSSIGPCLRRATTRSAKSGERLDQNTYAAWAGFIAEGAGEASAMVADYGDGVGERRSTVMTAVLAGWNTRDGKERRAQDKGDIYPP